ncbi:MAG: di-heme enzyme [Alphaproteobacteria bacterium]|nr:di-heme enzyme [Alphaproteobacteria bacterium]
MASARFIAGLLAAVVTLAAIGSSLAAAADYVWRIPSWLPKPAPPRGNAMSEAKVELGRYLFYDTRLSLDGTFSCATCHKQALAFTDGRAKAIGVTGQLHPRSAMSLANVAYNPVLTWANPLLRLLENQALVPMFNEHPVEMGLAGRERPLDEALDRDPRYQRMFVAAFPQESGVSSLPKIVRALAAFQRSLISANSPYDRYRYGGDPSAISDAAKRGEALFFGERLECHHCHGSFNMNDNVVHERTAFLELAFHNTGLYNLGGTGAYPPENTGVKEISGRPEHMGAFRTPTLRNIAVTAPYMHDGSIATLDGVIDHYAAGGRTIADGPLAGIGSKNPYKDILVPGFEISADERADLIAFLRSLTDEEFLSNPRFSDPFDKEPR